MPNTLFQKLNNMHWDAANIALIKQYLTTGQFPNNFSDSKKKEMD